MNSCILPVIEAELYWKELPVDWKVEGEDGLTITAGKETDLFTDPQGNCVKHNAPGVFFPVREKDVLLRAKVEVDFASSFDAGALVVYEHADLWGKCCFEFSPQKQPMIVSVVNRGVCDDCNSVVIEGKQVYMRVAKMDNTFAFHYSTDGRFWHMVRYFTLGELQDLKFGFSSQSPTGPQCTTIFSEISYTTERLKNIRNGE